MRGPRGYQPLRPAGEADGFPNGRRLIDDIVDIELRAVAGATPFTPEFDIAPNNQLVDGVFGNDGEFLTTFPYIPTPHPGYDTLPLMDRTATGGDSL